MRQRIADTHNGLPQHRRLRVAIVAAGIKQYDVAARVGVSEGHLSRLLAGRAVLTDDLAERIRVAVVELAA